MGRRQGLQQSLKDFEKNSKSQPAYFKGPALAYKNSDHCDYGVITEIKMTCISRGSATEPI